MFRQLFKKRLGFSLVSFFLLTLFSLTSCSCFFGGDSCDCKKEAAVLCDLLWSSPLTNSLKENNSAQSIYEFTSTTLNSAANYCCNEVAAAPASVTRTNGFYTSDPNQTVTSSKTSWGDMVVTADNALQSLGSCATSSYNKRATFNRNGTYVIEALLNATRNFQEREGFDNNDIYASGGRLSAKIQDNNQSFVVIHISHISHPDLSKPPLTFE